MKNRKAFTLIELLVVIAIIALLVSILLPSLNQAKDLPKNLLCKTNLRAIHTGIAMYVEDHEGYLPKCHSTFDGPYGVEWLGWNNSLTNYTEKDVNEIRATFSDIFSPMVVHRTWHPRSVYIDDYNIWFCPMEDEEMDWYTTYGINYEPTYSLPHFPDDGTGSGGRINTQIIKRPDWLILAADWRESRPGWCPSISWNKGFPFPSRKN